MGTAGARAKKEGSKGPGVVKLRLDPSLGEDELTRRLLEAFGSDDYRPPTLPSVATELMALSQKPDVGIDDVTELLERDSMLTGRIMKLVRSPVYSGGADIPSLQNAILRLGLNTLRDVVLETCMGMRVFRADAYTDTMERLRRHSTFTGYAARIVARYTAIDQEYAFLCGLLHDVGVAGALITMGEQKRRPDLAYLWPAIDRCHPKVGAVMARFWDLPMEVQLAIEYHHQVLVEGYPHPLAATIALADELAHEMGFGLIDEAEAGGGEDVSVGTHVAADRSVAATLDRAREALGLSDAQLELIRSEVEPLREQVG